MNDLITVMIADDHAPTRALVAEALTAQEFCVVAQAATAPDAVAAAQQHNPHVALIDLNMPGEGLTAIRQISDTVPDTSVVVFTVSRADADLFEALTFGAVGYLLKDSDPDRLGEALRGVLAGEAALPKRLVARLISEFRTRSHRRHLPLIGGRQVTLTEKEWAVLDGLREGRSTNEIAQEMGVTAVTVRTHIAAIVRKFRAQDRHEVLRILEEA
jgi:DNA-binding NarL/FixJ family response regulator